MLVIWGGGVLIHCVAAIKSDCEALLNRAATVFSRWQQAAFDKRPLWADVNNDILRSIVFVASEMANRANYNVYLHYTVNIGDGVSVNFERRNVSGRGTASESQQREPTDFAGPRQADITSEGRSSEVPRDDLQDQTSEAAQFTTPSGDHHRVPSVLSADEDSVEERPPPACPRSDDETAEWDRDRSPENAPSDGENPQNNEIGGLGCLHEVPGLRADHRAYLDRGGLYILNGSLVPQITAHCLFQRVCIQTIVCIILGIIWNTATAARSYPMPAIRKLLL